MKYMGSKRRLVKYIAPILEQHKGKYPRYIEPFVGGANMLCEITAYPEREGMESYLEARKQFLKLVGAKFQVADYTTLEPKDSVIYCDPPYKGTTKYSKSIDYAQLYSTLRKWAKNNIVYLSEYEAPFKCVWEKELSVGLKTGKKGIEKLFEVTQ